MSQLHTSTLDNTINHYSPYKLKLILSNKTVMKHKTNNNNSSKLGTSFHNIVS